MLRVQMIEISEAAERDALQDVAACNLDIIGGTVFGIQLNNLRVDAGLTQQALAERAGGLSMATVGSYEQGVRFPNYLTMLKLARGLGCHPAQLVPLVWEEDLKNE